ncbi:hypothetical protein [Cytobacillus praedii]|uniref:hypothetical protein n=1 Tax=Cytobacillus praedii TaxID=1742358 RepID=UPI003AF992BE
MYNSYWFLALIISSFITFCFILLKKRNTESLFLLLTMIGFGFIIETVIFNFLGSYDYNPNFIKHNSFYDNNLGAFASNAFALPVIATLIATFHLSWIWLFLFSGLFVGIEWLFLKLNIYSHNWWRLAYTGFGLPFYFATAYIFRNWIVHPVNEIKHFLQLYLIIGSISCSLQILPIIFLSNRVYTPGWFEDQGRDSIALAAIFYLCATLYYCLIIKVNWKMKWVKYALTGILMYTVDQVLISLDLLHSLVWWDQMYYVCLSLLLILLTGIIDRRLSQITLE